MDVKLKCKECGETFTITSGEAKWYEEKGFELPKRCQKCRKSRRRREGKRNESTEV